MNFRSLLPATFLLMGSLLPLRAADPIIDSSRRELSRWQPRLPETAATNLVPNSSFELGATGWSSLGERTGWNGSFSSLYGTITGREHHDGRLSLEVPLGPGRTPVTTFDCWPAASVVQHAPLAVNLGWITIQPGETYTLSAYMKASRAGVPARLVVRLGDDLSPNPQPRNEEKAVALTTSWQRYSFTVTAKDVSVCVGLGPDLRAQPDTEATVWIDAVQFERGGQATPYTPQAELEVALETAHFGNVYPAGTAPTLRLAALNRTGAPADVAVTVTLTDYFDEPVPGSSHTARVAAGATLDERIPLSLPGPGYYRLHATVTGPGLTQDIRFPLAVVHEQTGDDALFGLNHPPPTLELMNQFRRAGVLWGRDWSCDWHQVEPQQDVFAWEESDRQIDRLDRAGWQTLTLLPGFPSTRWASSVPDDFVIPPGAWRSYPEWVWLSAAPKHQADLVDYIRHVVGRYKDKVHTWEFMNEPGTSTALPSPYRGVPGFRYDAQAYLDWLKVAHAAVKAADPSARLVGGYALEVLHRAPHFIRAGGLEYVDILNIHPYALFEDRVEDFIPQLEELLALMDASPSGRKPIWVTETGFYGEDDKPRLPWNGPRSPFEMASERAAADQSMRQALLLLAHGVRKIFYHQGTNGDVNDGTMNLGNHLLGPNGVPQKVYPAVAYLAHLFGPDFSYAGPLAKPGRMKGVPTDNVYGYAFQCGPRAVLAVWAPTEWQRGHAWTLKVPRDVEAYNLVGTRLKEGGNGAVVPLGDSPIYLVTENMTAAHLARAQVLRVKPQPDATNPGSVSR